MGTNTGGGFTSDYRVLPMPVFVILIKDGPETHLGDVHASLELAKQACESEEMDQSGVPLSWNVIERPSGSVVLIVARGVRYVYQIVDKVVLP